jgi:hypothetical protein
MLFCPDCVTILLSRFKYLTEKAMVKCVFMNLVACLFSDIEHFHREVLCHQDKSVRRSAGMWKFVKNK